MSKKFGIGYSLVGLLLLSLQAAAFPGKPPAVNSAGEVSRAIADAQGAIRGREVYSVLIYGDPRVFPRARLGREIRRIEEAFGRPTILMEVNTLDDLKSGLAELTRRQLPIENLILRGIHGGALDNKPILEIHGAGGEMEGVTDFEELERSGVRLNLIPGARIHMDACSMIGGDEPAVILAAFHEVKRLGFSSGWIYMNRTEGANGVENTFTVPFYQQSDFKMKVRTLAGQASWVVTLPIFYYLDRYVMNQGYLYGEGAGRRVVFKTNSYAVEDGEIRGKLVYAD